MSVRICSVVIFLVTDLPDSVTKLQYHVSFSVSSCSEMEVIAGAAGAVVLAAALAGPDVLAATLPGPLVGAAFGPGITVSDAGSLSASMKLKNSFAKPS